MISKKILFLLFLIIFANVILLSKLVFFPYPELFTLPYMESKGLLPYTQIWDNHFPGPFFLPVNLRTLGLINEIAARYWQIGIVIILHLGVFYLTKLLTKCNKTALLANLLLLIWHPFLGGWVLWIDSFVAVFNLLAFIFIYKFILDSRQTLWVFLAGLFLGLSLFIKQTSLPVVFLSSLFILYFYRNRITIYWFALGLLPLNILVLAYLWQINTLKDFWYWAIVYNFSPAAHIAYKAPEIKDLLKTLVIYSPFIFILKIRDPKQILLFAIFIIGGLAGYTDRFDTIHLQPSLPFIVILTAMIISIIISKHTYKLFFFSFFVVYFILSFKMLTTFYTQYSQKTVWYFDEQTFTLTDQVKQITKPNEEIFLFGPVPLIYVFSDTIPANRVFTLIFPWTMPIVEDTYVSLLTINPPQLILRDLTFAPDGKPIAVFASKINNFIESNYQTVKTIGTTEFMRKKAF